MKKISLLFSVGLLMAFNQLIAQSITINGNVIDAEENEVVIGGSVVEKGTSNGVATDLDGNYTITVTDKNAVLIFSYTGLETQEIVVNEQTVINVNLKSNTALLKEVVVIGYGTQKRSNISGAVSTVTSDEITETPVLRAEQALQGRTAGVQVAQVSGSPGSALTVRIRGIGTINNSDPLYIIDGVPVEGIDYLNPNDIESMNVLKDAASAAIYGARGANGVVLITTKGGKKNQGGKVSYDAYFGDQRPWKKMNLLTAEQYAIIRNEAQIAGGLTPLPEFSNPGSLGKGTDWQDEIFTSAPIMNHQLSFMGGGEKTSYAISGNYFNQEGIVGGKKAGFERYTVRINTTTDVKPWLTIGNTLGITNFNRNALIENNEFNSILVRALNMDPVTPVRKADGTYAYSIYSDTDITNPVNAIEQTYDTWISNRIVGSIFGEIKLTNELRLKSTYSVDATFATKDVFRPKFDLSNDPVLSDAPAQEKNLINSVSKEHNTWKNWQWENVLTYEHLFAKRHNVSIVAGNTILSNRHDYSGGGNTNLPTNDPADAFISNTIDPISSQSAYAGATESSLISYFGRVNYEFDDKYLASVTLRADGSSKFGVNNRYGYFPSFSLGWIASREDFWNIDLINFFKVRGSWGQNGNDRIGDYSFTTIVNAGQNYTFGPNEIITNGNVPLVAANPDLKWETSTQTNIGIDLELWDGRFNFTSDYYIKNTSDMLYSVPIPFTGGVLPPTQNIGSMENSGLEFSLNYRNRDNKFKYSVGGNIAFTTTKVISLGEGGEPISTGNVFSAGNVARTEVGHPVAAFYGFVTDGIFQTEEEVKNHAFQNENSAPGDIRFKDLNGDNIIDNLDQTFIGNPTPKFNFGINASCEYLGFDLSLFILGVQGNDVYNGIVRYDFSYTNRPQSILNRWTGPGTSNSEPRVNTSDPNFNARASDRFLEDGSFIRLRNLQLGYSLPEDLIGKWHIDKIRVYVSANNLFTFTNYSGLDPEIGSRGGLDIGIDRGFYPSARTILGGLNITF